MKSFARLYCTLNQSAAGINKIKVKDQTVEIYGPYSHYSSNKEIAVDKNGEYEGPFLSRMIDEMQHFIEGGQKIIYLDIGGGHGLDACVLRHFLDGNFFSYIFEPDNISSFYLARNTSSSFSEIIKSYVGEDSDGIQTVSIDDFCEKRGLAPTHIKIDIEGMEIYALKGMLRTLKKYKPKLYIEFHEIFILQEIPNPEFEIRNFFDTLAELDYIVEYNSHHYLLFSKQSEYYDYTWFSKKPNQKLYALACR